MATQRIETAFGPIEVRPGQLWSIAGSLAGFPELRHFVLLDVACHRPLVWLQAIEDPSVCFALAAPATFSLTYPPVPTAALFGTPVAETLLMLMVILERQGKNRIVPQPHRLAPLCLDLRRKRLTQWILSNPRAVATTTAPVEKACLPPLEPIAVNA